MKILASVLVLMSLVISVGCDDEGKPSDNNQNIFKVDGVVNGGGGKGVVCDGKIVTLDLYEARQRGVDIPDYHQPYEEYIIDKLVQASRYKSMSYEDATRPDLEELIREGFDKEVKNSVVDIPVGFRLPNTGDIGPVDLEPGCSLVQLAIMTENKTIYRDLNYWNQLSDIEKTALMLHEVIYFFARKQGGALDSDESRIIVGDLMSGSPPAPIYEPVWKANQVLNCFGGDQGSPQELFEIMVIEEEKDGVQGLGFHFFQFKNYIVNSRTYGFTDQTTLDELQGNIMQPINLIVSSQVLGKKWEFEIRRYDEFSLLMRAIGDGENPPPYSYGFCNL